MFLCVGYRSQREGLNLDSIATNCKLLAPSLREHKGSISTRTASDDAGHQQPTDEVLLKCIKEGDSEAMSCLFRRYARTLYSIGRRILRDIAEAEDLVQEVFVYVHRKHSLYDSSRGTARSWIFQIAYTQAFLRRRRLKSHGLYALAVADVHRETEIQTHSGTEYDRSVEGLFGRNRWKQIVEDLTVDQRETFRLHFFEGCTFAEIAEKLGQSFANVRNHHYRGLEKLRKHLAGREFNRR
jgi:RNA polymerase sigma-70 factor (ECF subfamily)